MIRYLCSELVQITSLGPQKRSQSGNLEEIGPTFAEVLTEQALPRKSSVRITCKNFQLHGIVESCAFERALGYFVRLKLAPLSWSEKWFTPKHLFTIKAPETQVNRLGAASGY